MLRTDDATDHVMSKSDVDLMLRALRNYASHPGIDAKERERALDLARITDAGFETVTRDYYSGVTR